ncbi:MAG: DNA mismatch repair endonuclease MutL, partial [Bacillota bacterium]|nr:DNA mismatch repair endonuclease MutL [Bacillota bacterium]
MIRVLDKKTADKIAAGEVVDRPASIVKELVENSIDSGATAVTIEIKKGGKEYIRVTDNGSGITDEDAELAFKRHATSKIQSEKDLLSIGTLGFRGEALASICAVSRIELITKVRDSRVGRRIIVEGSEILSNTPTGCPEGTTVTVKDLFYNVPARRKFLGSDGIETRRIIDLASRIALSYPDIRFTVINSSNRVFSTSGRGNILESIISIYGTDIGKDLIPIEGTLEKGEERYILKGFVSNPGNTLSNRNRQIFCVNGRVVSSKTIERGIDKAYKERVFAGRFPIAFIFISVPSKRLDVNIHPTKKEIRFDDNTLIEDFVWETVASGLVGDESIPSFGLSEKNLVKATEVEEIIEKRKIQDNSEQVQLNYESQSPKVVAENTFQYEKTEDNTSDREEVDIKHLLTTIREEQEKETEDREKLVKKLEISKPAKIPFEIGELEIVGSIFNTYIACQLRDSFYLIDQHAAHERVF